MAVTPGTLTQAQIDFLVFWYGQNNIDSIMQSSDDDQIVALYMDAVDTHGEPEPDWTNKEWYIYANTNYQAGTIIGASGRTVGELYDVYFQLQADDPGQYRRLNETLLANGWYGTGATIDSLKNRGASERAFGDAVDSLVARGESPIGWDSNYYADLLENKAPAVTFDNLGNEKPVDGGGLVRRMTEAQVFSSADAAARQTFGRSASSQERQLALSVVRSLEESEVSQPGVADIESALREASPVEARERDMSGALQNFMSIVRGR